MSGPRSRRRDTAAPRRGRSVAWREEETGRKGAAAVRPEARVPRVAAAGRPDAPARPWWRHRRTDRRNVQEGSPRHRPRPARRTLRHGRPPSCGAGATAPHSGAEQRGPGPHAPEPRCLARRPAGGRRPFRPRALPQPATAPPARGAAGRGRSFGAERNGGASRSSWPVAKGVTFWFCPESGEIASLPRVAARMDRTPCRRAVFQPSRFRL